MQSPIQLSTARPLRIAVEQPLEMKTDVTTRSPPDNRATAIEARPIPSSVAHHSDAAVAVIDVDGLLLNRNMNGIGSMGENPLALFREKLDAVASDGRAQAVVLRINSPGGSVTASDVMRRDLVDFKQRTGLPVVACIMDTGTGGGYYLATACDIIVAHPTSVVGSIGVILNLYNLEDTMAQFNAFERAVRAGDKIDAGSPVRPIEDVEQDMLQQIADRFHTRFIDTVVASRPQYNGLRQQDFDGRVFSADQALSLGLIDRIGYLDDAVAVAAQQGNCDTTHPTMLLYRRDNDRARTSYDVTPNIPLQNGLFPLSIPGVDRSRLPVFLYLWQLDPTLERSGA